MDFRSLFSLPSYEDILSQYPDADPSTVSAKVIASGGETSSASLKLSVSAEDGAITSSAIAVAEVDDQKVETTASAEAAGETASTSLDLVAIVDEQGAEATVLATAEAEAEEGGTATASTDAQATGFDSVKITQSPAGGEATESGDNPAISSTELQAFGLQNPQVETIDLTPGDELVHFDATDVDWLL